MAGAVPSEDLLPRWRPKHPSSLHGRLFQWQKQAFTAWPKLHRTLPAPDDLESAVQIEFRYNYNGKWAVPDIPVYHAKQFVNKATVLYTHNTTAMQEHQIFRTAFELWTSLTADQEIATPGFGHYPITPVHLQKKDGFPKWLEVIQTHKLLAKRIKEHEGQICLNPYAPAETSHHYVVREPFSRCLIVTGRLRGQESEWETWLLAEKCLIGDIGEKVEGSGESDCIWVRKKMGLTEALQVILNIPEDRLGCNSFRIRWDQMTEQDCSTSGV